MRHAMLTARYGHFAAPFVANRSDFHPEKCAWPGVTTPRQLCKPLLQGKFVRFTRVVIRYLIDAEDILGDLVASHFALAEFLDLFHRQLLAALGDQHSGDSLSPP